jgi:hypothetical protein
MKGNPKTETEKAETNQKLSRIRPSRFVKTLHSNQPIIFKTTSVDNIRSFFTMFRYNVV